MSDFLESKSKDLLKMTFAVTRAGKHPLLSSLATFPDVHAKSDEAKK